LKRRVCVQVLRTANRKSYQIFTKKDEKSRKPDTIGSTGVWYHTDREVGKEVHTYINANYK